MQAVEIRCVFPRKRLALYSEWAEPVQVLIQRIENSLVMNMYRILNK